MMLQKILFLCLMLVSVLFATGCTGTDTPSSAVPVSLTISPGPAIVRTNQVPVTLQPSASATAEATPAPARIFSGEHHWAEYRINNTITLPPNPRYQWEYAVRLERSYEDVNGTPAVHEKISVIADDSVWRDGNLVTINNGFHATEEAYCERATKRFLGGTSTVNGAGLDNQIETIPGDDTYHGDRHWGWLLISPFEEMDDPISFEGTKSVTVPAGT